MRRTIASSLVMLSLILAISGFALTIQPFGLFGNVSLVRHDFTALLKFVPFAEFEFGQNILSMGNINALLNEEDFKVDKTTLSSALQSGFQFALPVSLGAYADLKLGALRFVPYTRVDGNINLTLPKTFAELLVGDTQIDETYESSYTNFFNANITANGGIAIVIGDIYVAGNLFTPVLYSDPQTTMIDVSYTSSATPAYAELSASGKIRAYSRISLNDLMSQNIQNLVNDLSNFEDYGISVEVGYGNDVFGIAVRNIVISPAKAWYSVEVIGNGKITYTAEGTNITADATYSVSDPIVARLITPVSVAPPMQITAYLKNDGFIMWGVMGSYWLDGNWAVKGYAGLNIGIAKAYYILGYNQITYSHTIGVGMNLFFLNADLKLTATTNSFIPTNNSTPGIGFSLTISGGL
ncbi:hypothetical protein SAMN04488510_1063 [Fervidobacterium changbaicum]|uniref:DUF5723 domain-containing protein n=1 Tax=Fervidobacterium changbaicum TaxID=310769 RepID=A0ABX5QSX5_9BACT|nr:hypothetical protein [Fervidobacterium changbaicum]QAV33503.1 hypothetical protein CBS1_07085 [Fervidobacterium changbaicum]SDH13926.1 hypothetical protein SAMN04488510_1063 [Fervidobacterium changbaicum]